MKFITAIFYIEEGKSKVLYEVNPHETVKEAVDYTQDRTKIVKKELGKRLKKEEDITGRTFQSGVPSYDLR